MLRVGLTGGIGSGKTTVAELFARRAIPVIDADTIARRLSARGQPAFHHIIEYFGKEILGADQEIDRQRLRARVFNAPQERRQLEAILHPRVRQAMQQEIEGLHAPYCILAIPLLIEAGFLDLVDRVLVVDTDEQLQIHRVMARNSMDADTVKKILASQTDRAQRLAYAHDCIVNDADLKHLEREVERLHQAYIACTITQN